MSVRRWPIALMLLLCTGIATAKSDRERWFSFSFDNDIFVGSDGGYTNGLYFSWYDLPDGADSKLKSTPWYYRLQTYLTRADSTGTTVLTYNLGQTMITPADIEKVPPDADDTPYAGLLFWQGTVLFGRGEVTDFSTLFLGVVGPWSLAEQSQKLVHSATGSDEPKGWDYQLKNEPLIRVSYGRFWQNFHGALARNARNLEYDIVTGAQGGLGNFMSSVEIAAYFRVGSKLDTSYSLLALSSGREINPTAHSGGWFTYIGVSTQYVFNNIVFDGNTFRDSPSVTWEHAQNSYTFGVATSSKNWGFSFSYSNFGGFKADGVGRQKFGSISIVHRLE